LYELFHVILDVCFAGFALYRYIVLYRKIMSRNSEDDRPATDDGDVHVENGALEDVPPAYPAESHLIQPTINNRHPSSDPSGMYHSAEKPLTRVLLSYCT